MSFKITPSDVNIPVLTDEQLLSAKTEMFHPVTFPKVNRRFVDPSKQGEPRFALMSYIPKRDDEMTVFLEEIKQTLSKKHKARLEQLENRQDIVHGVLKIRGAYHTPAEAEARSEEIIREIDSANSIFTCVIGVPYPLVSSGQSLDLEEIDLQKETEKTIIQNVREKRKKEQKEIEEMKQREEELMKDTNKDPHEREEEDYIEHRVKLAHLRYTINEHHKKRTECIALEKDCVQWLLDVKNKHPEYEKNYMTKYLDARKKANIPEEQDGEGFMKYMKDPIYILPDCSQAECDNCPQAECDNCPRKKANIPEEQDGPDCSQAECDNCPQAECDNCPSA